MDVPFLRLCPFCDSGPMVIELDEHVWVVVCSYCEAIGPHPEAEQDYATAIQRWNQGCELPYPMRAPPNKTDWEMVAMVVAALASLAILGVAVYVS